MTYAGHAWVNDKPPAISATALNEIEDAIRQVSGRSYLAMYDEFARYPDGPLNGKVPLVGPTWQTTGQVPTVVQNGLATSPGVGYCGADVGAPLRGLTAEMIFTGTTSAPMAIINSADYVGWINGPMIHPTVGPHGLALSVRNGGSFDFILPAQGWSRPCLRDGVTSYRFTVLYDDETVTFIGPFGEVIAVRDKRLAQFGGRLAIWEPMTVAGPAQGFMKSCAALVAAPTGKTSPFEFRTARAAGSARYGPHGQAVGNPDTIDAVYIGVNAIRGYGFPGIIFGPWQPILAGLTVAANIGDTSITTDRQIPNGSSIQIETGPNSETVVASAGSTGPGAHGPFVTAVPALTKAHPINSGMTITAPSTSRADIYLNGARLNVGGDWVIGGLAFIGSDLTTSLSRVATGVIGTNGQTVLRTGRGTTAQRPAAATVGAGAAFYDTTLSKPIWSDGTVWKDAVGTAV